MQEKTFIYGRHAVTEAINRRPDVVRIVYVREELLQEGEVAALVQHVTSRSLSNRTFPKGVDKKASHQGIIAEIDTEALLIPFKEFRDTVVANLHTSVVVLGEVQDPHNVGAIIRSAAAFGVSAVLIPEHRGCPVTGTVIKVSAGTAFSIPLVQVGNINTALRDLKEKGFWVYGLDGDGETSVAFETFSKPSVFVVGNEATGMRLKTHEVCDTILHIPMDDRAESLNASVSAAVVLYAWSISHSNKLNKHAV